MKKRNTLLILGALLSSVGLAACSSSMNTKGKGITQLMNDNQERVFYNVDDSNNDNLPGKDEKINYIYITKSGKLKGYYIDEKLTMDEVVGKNINEIKKLAEENSKENYENDKVTASVLTNGNNTKQELIKMNPTYYNSYTSLTSGQIRDKYYAGYVSYRSGPSSANLLITEVSKGNVIDFDKADGKIIEETHH
ncbi:hypothetical protein [Streptococcus mitis]|uniref:hypothetical protein n=1 Tax=Streptococcus mitis TaxID=28037 RepID=UPI0021B6ECB0|nr:hypothetical protein [Streptococcus mitis]